jgi:hypothetical protein
MLGQSCWHDNSPQTYVQYIDQNCFLILNELFGEGYDNTLKVITQYMSDFYQAGVYQL